MTKEERELLAYYESMDSDELMDDDDAFAEYSELINKAESGPQPTEAGREAMATYERSKTQLPKTEQWDNASYEGKVELLKNHMDYIEKPTSYDQAADLISSFPSSARDVFTGDVSNFNVSGTKDVLSGAGRNIAATADLLTTGETYNNLFGDGKASDVGNQYQKSLAITSGSPDANMAGHMTRDPWLAPAMMSGEAVLGATGKILAPLMTNSPKIIKAISYSGEAVADEGTRQLMNGEFNPMALAAAALLGPAASMGGDKLGDVAKAKFKNNLFTKTAKKNDVQWNADAVSSQTEMAKDLGLGFDYPVAKTRARIGGEIDDLGIELGQGISDITAHQKFPVEGASMLDLDAQLDSKVYGERDILNELLGNSQVIHDGQKATREIITEKVDMLKQDAYNRFYNQELTAPELKEELALIDEVVTDHLFQRVNPKDGILGDALKENIESKYIAQPDLLHNTRKGLDDKVNRKATNSPNNKPDPLYAKVHKDVRREVVAPAMDHSLSNNLLGRGDDVIKTNKILAGKYDSRDAINSLNSLSGLSKGMGKDILGTIAPPSGVRELQMQRLIESPAMRALTRDAGRKGFNYLTGEYE